MRTGRSLLQGMVLVWAGLASAGSALQAQERRAMTVDDFLSFQIPADPRISPDGALIAFTVTTPSLAENRNVTRLWVHSLVDGTTRQLTRDAGSDVNPRWARDGRTLAFLSTRGGSAQVWRIRTDGGEPSRLTNLAGGVNDFWWSPDSLALFVSADVKWPASTEIDTRNGNHPTDARIWTDLMYRHWNAWRTGIRQHLFRVDLASGAVVDITPFDRDVPTLALGGQDVDVSPLGTELAVVYNPDSSLATSTNNEIYLVGPDGAGMVPMTNQPGNDHSPAYSPNARWIAYLSMETAGFEADRQQLVVYDRATGERTSLTTDWDVSVGAFTWAPDSRSLVAEIQERGQVNLYRLPVPAGPPVLLVSGGHNSAPRFMPRGQGLVFIRQTASQPPDLFYAALDTRNVTIRPLTRLNETRLATLDLKPTEFFSFVGARGDSVHGLLIKPPGFDSTVRYPVAYLLHGGPQGAWLDNWHARWNYAMFAARGYVVAAVNFHGSTGYGQAFTNSVSRQWGSLPYEDLMKGVDWLEGLPFVDRTRIGAAGGSYGGYMAYWIAGHTNRFKALVAHDGIYNTESMAGTTEEQWFPIWEFGGPLTSPEARTLLAQWSPANFVQQWQTPLLVVHGQQDFRVDVSEGFQAFTAARLKGVPTKFLYFPDEGHFVLKPRNRRLWWGVVLDWLDEYLQPARSRTSP